MSDLLPFLLFSAFDNQLLKQMLPTLLPGPRANRMVLAAITARDQIKTEQAVVVEAIKAGKFASADELARSEFQALAAAYKRLPAAVQSGVFTAAPPPGGGSRRGAEPT
jgi:hypothetical protein